MINEFDKSQASPRGDRRYLAVNHLVLGLPALRAGLALFGRKPFSSRVAGPPGRTGAI